MHGTLRVLYLSQLLYGISVKIWPAGKVGLVSGLDWTFYEGNFFFFLGGGALFFLVCKKNQPFPNRLYFFHLGGGGEGRKGVVLYRLYSSLLFVGFVLCLSFLVWEGGLDWSLCMTHGRHVSLES